MGWYDIVEAWLSLAVGTAEKTTGLDIPWSPTGELVGGAPATIEDSPTNRQVLTARRDLAIMLAVPFVVIPAVPVIYAALQGRKRPKNARTAQKQEMVGVALENASNASSTLLQTALAAPVVAAAYTYIAVQKAETGKIISKGLGDAVQTLLAVSAAGPAIQGITSTVSAFAKKGK